MTDKKPDDMSEEEPARFYEERRGDLSLWDKSRKIRVRRGSPSTVFTLRLAPEELEELSRASAAKGETMSDFIRKGAMERVQALRKQDKRAQAS